MNTDEYLALDSVDIIMGDTDLCPWDMGTWGSMTTRFFGPPLRAAAAEAKGVLLELAAESLSVSKTQLVASEGVIFDSKHSQHRVTYGELAKGRTITRPLTVKPPLEAPSDFTVIGKPVLRRDSRDKVTGTARYAGDIRVPGMLYARLLRPPAHGARLKSVDTGPAGKIPGVQVIQDGDLVAVLHELPDVAEKALAAVTAEFDVPEPTVDDRSIFDHLVQAAPRGNVVASGGEPAIIVMGAVVANAIHDATGARLLQLPMTPERVNEAIAQA